MPCRCDDYPAYPTRGVYDDTALKERNAIKKDLDEVTQNLCYLCGTLIYNGSENIIRDNKRLYQWWKNHLANDEKRVREEMRKIIPRLPIDKKNAFYIQDLFIKKASKVHPVSVFHQRWFLYLADQVLQEFEFAVKREEEKNILRDQALSKLSDAERAALGI